MRRHHDARLLGETPEAVEDRIGGRPQAVGGDRGAVADGDDTRAVVEAPLELLDEPVRVRRVQVRNSEDAVLVGEAPLVFDPAVERPAHLDRRLDVGRQHRRLEHDALRREQPHGLDALRVHDLQALVALVPLGVLRRRLVERREEFLSGQLPREVVHERARLRPGVHVAGPGQHREDLAVEDVAQHAVDFLHLHAALGELRIAVPGERVARLPVVVVGVEDRRDLVAGRSPCDPPDLSGETLLAEGPASHVCPGTLSSDARRGGTDQRERRRRPSGAASPSRHCSTPPRR